MVQLCRGWGYEYKRQRTAAGSAYAKRPVLDNSWRKKNIVPIFNLDCVFPSTLSALPPVARDESLIDVNQF